MSALALARQPPASFASFRQAITFFAGFAAGYVVFSLSSQRVAVSHTLHASADASALWLQRAQQQQQQLGRVELHALVGMDDAMGAGMLLAHDVASAAAAAEEGSNRRRNPMPTALNEPPMPAHRLPGRGSAQPGGGGGGGVGARDEQAHPQLIAASGVEEEEELPPCPAESTEVECTKARLAAWMARNRVRIPAGNDLSQESLCQRLLPVWGTSTPRVMVDLGSHPAFGDMQQYGDALIFLEYFHAPGGSVLAVDAMPDFATDIQRRFDELEPYRSYAGVEKISLGAWVGNADSLDDPPSTLPRGPNMTFQATRQLGYCLAGHSFDHRVKYCELERQGRPEHMCRVTRERLGIVCQPGSSGPQPLPATPPPKRATVPLRSIDSLWRHELKGRHIDLLKVDIEASWNEHYGAGASKLLAARAVSLLVVEVDRQWRADASGNVGVTVSQAVASFVGLCEGHGYAVYLKVPCAFAVLRDCRIDTIAAGACAVNSLRNRTIGYERYLKLSHDKRQRLPAGLKLQQDLLVVDTARPELLRLIDAFGPPCPLAGPPDVYPRGQPAISIGG
jgi:hypothetical protein